MYADAKKKRVNREFQEAKALIKLISGKWWAPVLHHSPNEEMHPIARQLAAAHGTKPGFPDFLLVLRSGNHYGLAIELKAAKPHGRRPTPAQVAWLDHFRDQGWQAHVCYGVEEALATLNLYTEPATRERDSFPI